MNKKTSWWNSDSDDLYRRYSIPRTNSTKKSSSYRKPLYKSNFSFKKDFSIDRIAGYGKWFLKNPIEWFKQQPREQLIKKLLYIWWGLLWVYILWVFLFVATQLPVITIESLENGQFSQTSVVTDRNDEVLYKFFEENREFVSYENIAPQAINAFVAIEDQSFWENGGVDYRWLMRTIFSSIKRVLGIDARVWWASTITQQLLKNILLLNKNEDSFYDTVVRKHKERLLVGKLADVIKADVRAKNPNASADVITRKQKERVMELYINFIYLGNQTYWIEAASQSYFNKSAKDLSIVESAILASMPQSPSYYDLYKNPQRVLGKLSITSTDGTSIISWEIYNSVVNYIWNLMFDNKNTISKWNFQKYISNLIPENINIWNSIYTVSYTIWRKEAVLNRMYEDGYITEEELKKAFIEWLLLNLGTGKIIIKTPHFVFWIRDLITKDPRFADLEITEDMLYGGWLVIKTSLDSKIQDIAEKSIKDNMPILYDRWWNNRSMIHIDTLSGDVLAYVWSADYNNAEIEGQNDMVRNKRQPWSSVKPLVYAYLLQNLPISIDTPIYDIEFTVGWLTPRNADGKFNGPLPLRNALAFSRNIPAVKAYLAAWQEEKIKPFLQSLWLTSLESNHEYGYSMALGAWEVAMLEMAQAYLPLSRQGKTVEINPILEIKDKNGNILYQKKVEEKDSAIKPWVAYLMWSILSNPWNMPSGWVNYYSIKWLKYAVKSWTSNKVIKEGDKEISVPRDGWLATYTPSRVTMYWAGNANDKPMNKNALWLLLNSEVNKSFYSQLLSNWYIQNENMTQPSDVSTVTISKITWRLANENTPEEFKVSTLTYNKNIPWDDTYTTISVDKMCGGKISPLTPADQRQRAYVFTPISITSFDNQDIVKRYAEQNKKLMTEPDNIYAKLFVQEPTEYCEWRAVEESETVQLSTSLTKNQNITNKISLSFTAESTTNKISKVTILINDVIVWNYSYNTALVQDTKELRLSNLAPGKVTMQIIAVDEQGKARTLSLPLMLVAWDSDKPNIDKSAISVKQTEWGYSVKLAFIDPTSGIANSTIKLPNGEKKVFQWSNAEFIVSELGIISYSVIDSFNNQTDGTVNLSEYL